MSILQERRPIISHHHPLHRRSFLCATTTIAAAAALPATLLARKNEEEPHEQDGYISTNEGLMREHGIQRRVLLIYAEVIRRIDAQEDFPSQTVIESAEIIRKYIEDYHQKLEEEHIFPLFRKYYVRPDVLRLYAQKLLDLVNVLDEQHQAGRRLTDRVLSTLGSLKSPSDRRKLAHDLRAYIRMYEPHLAREDTVLLPALHVIVTRQEYKALGDKFHETEHKAFGGEGFEIYLDLITAFEKRLDIYNLAQFTPK